jgi:Leucine-rich repeat (LRR) protein
MNMSTRSRVPRGPLLITPREHVTSARTPTPTPTPIHTNTCTDNQITRIEGIAACSHLTELRLAHNAITELTNLGGLPLKHLDLSHNALSSTQGLEGLLELQVLDLSHNAIHDITRGFHAGLQLLGHVHLAHNRIAGDLEQFERIPHLTHLDLSANPLAQNPQHRSLTIFRIPRLARLDGLPIAAEEKVKALNIHDPPHEVLASMQHVEMLKSQAKMYAKLRASDGMVARHVRPIILCGPSGAGKR